MSDETTKEGAADEEQESYFEDSLFLNKRLALKNFVYCVASCHVYLSFCTCLVELTTLSYKKRTISCGGHEICIMVSESASSKCFYRFIYFLSTNKVSAADYDLTGQVIWPCASHLCKYVIDKRSEFEGKTVLEVGSGVGICGLFAGELHLFLI